MRGDVLLLLCFLVCLVFIHGSCLEYRYKFEPSLQLKVTTFLDEFYGTKNPMNPGRIPFGIGNIGVPGHGGTLIGTVVYPQANHKACRSFHDYNVSFKSRHGDLPNVVLIHRGDCFFSTKVLNAQEAGASAVLVMDNFDRPPKYISSVGMIPEEGFGDPHLDKDITIPSALISWFDGYKLRIALSNGEPANINLEFPYPDGENKGLPSIPDHEPVKYELWINANLDCGLNCKAQIEFIKNFKEVAKTLHYFAEFTPHYLTWKCPEAMLSSFCKYHCINNGRYCAPGLQLHTPYTPVNLNSKIHIYENKGEIDVSFKEDRRAVRIQYSEKEVVVQSLRQTCLFLVASENAKPWLWWDYVSQFATQCTLRQRTYNKQCFDEIILSLGVDLDKIYNCMGDTEVDAENPILEAEQDLRVGKLGPGRDVSILPTLVINGKAYRGKLEVEEVLKAICGEIQVKEKPYICHKSEMETGIWL